jgi:hypothetical protein
MNRTVSHPRPVILPMPTLEVEPKIVRFPGRRNSRRRAAAKSASEPRDSVLSEARDRLFRMIVANEWDRSHGNRAS